MLKSDKPPLNILIAYPYFSEGMRKTLNNVSNTINVNLMVDSGAFTAHASGKEISLKEHLTFLDSLSDYKYIAIQLDVMFNPKKTEENFYKSLELGYNVCPVFTRGEELSYLKRLIEEDHYIFFGALGGGGVEQYFERALPFLVEKETRFHLLGHVKPSTLKKYRPTSVDASSWSSCMRFGVGSVYYKGRIRAFDRSHFKTKPTREFLKPFFDMGFTIKEIQKLSKETSWHCHSKLTGTPDWHFASFVSTCSHIYLSMMSEHQIGTKIYLAVGTPAHLDHIALCYKFLDDRGKLKKFKTKLKEKK